jgi:hypothetical protein
MKLPEEGPFLPLSQLKPLISCFPLKRYLTTFHLILSSPPIEEKKRKKKEKKL